MITEITLEQMVGLAADCAADLKQGDVVLLKGEVGAGKTTFARFLIGQLAGADVEVVSPTFTLCQTYETPKGEVHHYDLYRLKSAEEVMELGLLEQCSTVITVIEWPELIEHLLPSTCKLVYLSVTSDTLRRIALKGWSCQQK